MIFNYLFNLIDYLKGKYRRFHSVKQNSALNIKTQLSHQTLDKDNMKHRE